MALLLGGEFDGGDDDDQISVAVSATGGDGGNGGAGGVAGDGGNDVPVGGDHVNLSTSGDGGHGGRGGDATAEVDGMTVLGGSGEDEIELVVEVEAGQGGSGGQGGNAGAGQFVDTTKIDNGLFLDAEYEGEVHAILGAAGDGGDAGDNGIALALVTDNVLDGGADNDEIVLEVIVETPDQVLGASAGDSGINGTLTPEETGDYTVHQTAGIAGSDGMDGDAGSARAEITGNRILGGSGDDTIELIVDVTGEGTTELIFEGNEIDGGTGFDIADFSAMGAALDIDLSAGTFAVGDGVEDNAISAIEKLITTMFDDTVMGSASNETLNAGAGDDTISGGGGQDVFVFDEGDGADSIEDFSGDMIDLSTHSGAVNFGSLVIVDTAEGAEISFATGDSILLKGVAASALDETHFTF